jgi:hypothetical protein
MDSAWLGAERWLGVHVGRVAAWRTTDSTPNANDSQYDYKPHQ